MIFIAHLQLRLINTHHISKSLFWLLGLASEPMDWQTP